MVALPAAAGSDYQFGDINAPWKIKIDPNIFLARYGTML